jgi:large subunit ribosomal protein L4e
MKASVLSISGEVKEEIELPPVFSTPYRPDLIKRAVHAIQSSRRKPYGPSIYAGILTSAESWGVGHGVARVPRIKEGRRAARVPQARGGRRAHPPRVEKKWKLKINKKEKLLALKSAIAATSREELVSARGHKFSSKIPPIVEDEIEKLEKAKEIKDFLLSAGLWDDVERAKKRKVRSGKGKLRGRKYKKKKSILFVVKNMDGFGKAASNFPGIDVVPVDELSVEHLAPGTHPGRLTVYTKGSIKKLEEL